MEKAGNLFDIRHNRDDDDAFPDGEQWSECKVNHIFEDDDLALFADGGEKG